MFHCTRIKERGLNVRIRGISLLNMVGKIYMGMLVDTIHSDKVLLMMSNSVPCQGVVCIDQLFTLKQRSEEAWEQKERVYVGLEMEYDRINRKVLLWQMLRMYNEYSKHLNGIKSMFVKSQACIRLKVGERKCFMFQNDSGMREGCIMSLWLFSVYMNAVMKDVKMGKGRMGEWRLPRLFCMQI